MLGPHPRLPMLVLAAASLIVVGLAPSGAALGADPGEAVVEVDQPPESVCVGETEFADCTVAASRSNDTTALLVAVSGTGNATGGLLALSATGDTSSLFLAVSGTGNAAGALAGISGTGQAFSSVVAVSGQGEAACGVIACLGAASGTGNATCLRPCDLVVSGTGNATCHTCFLSASGTGDASEGVASVSLTGEAAGLLAGASATGDASGCIAVSGTGQAEADCSPQGQVLALSGCETGREAGTELACGSPDDG